MTKTRLVHALSESTGLQRKDVASVLGRGRGARLRSFLRNPWSFHLEGFGASPDG